MATFNIADLDLLPYSDKTLDWSMIPYQWSSLNLHSQLPHFCVVYEE